MDTEPLGLVTAAVADIKRLPPSIKMMKAYHALQESRGEQVDKSSLEFMTETLPLLEEERARGFSLYFGLATISIWCTLEAHVDDLLAKYIELGATVLGLEPIRRLKVPLGEFEAMTAEERRYYILSLSIATFQVP